MADKEKATTATAKEPVVACKYTVEELKEAAYDLFGDGPHVVDGAFCGKDLTATYTVREAKEFVEAFLHKPVVDKKEDK